MFFYAILPASYSTVKLTVTDLIRWYGHEKEWKITDCPNYWYTGNQMVGIEEDVPKMNE